MQVSGIVKDVSKQSSGQNAKGAWTMQWVELVDGQRVKIWTHPDLSAAKNKHITIDGAVEDKDKEGKPCLTLMANDGTVKIEERQPGTQLPAGVPPASLSKPVTPRTIEDYENVLSRAIEFVTGQLKNTTTETPRAVAMIVTSYMAAYVRGDFAVTDEETPF